MNEINFEIKDVEKIDLSMDVGVKEIFPPIENLEVTPTKEQQVFNHNNSYGYDEVIVNPIPDEYIIPDGTLEVTENGDIDVTTFKIARVGVYTPPNLQDKSITITENGTQNITFDEGYDGLNSVEVITNVVNSEDDTDITTVSKMNEKLIEVMNSWVSNILNMPNNYSSLYNEPITLYTPAEGYTKYIIRYRSSRYSIVWLPDDADIIYIGSSTFGVGYPTFNRVEYNPNISTTNIVSFGIKYPTGYGSVNTYSTLEDCITAMQSPDTSYTTGGTTGWGHNISKDTLPVIPSNMVAYNSSQLELHECSKISSNETIVVIQ